VTNRTYGTFEATFTLDMQNKALKEFVLTTVVNRDGVQTSMSVNSEGKLTLHNMSTF
jgi:hypothetical protein